MTNLLLSDPEEKLILAIRRIPRIHNVITAILDLIYHKRNCRVMIEVSPDGTVRIYNVNPSKSFNVEIPKAVEGFGEAASSV